MQHNDWRGEQYSGTVSPSEAMTSRFWTIADIVQNNFAGDSSRITGDALTDRDREDPQSVRGPSNPSIDPADLKRAGKSGNAHSLSVGRRLNH